MSFLRRTALNCLLAALYFLPAGCAPVEVRTLPQAPAREQTIQGGETQSMTLEVAAGQFLGLVVEQDRVDVVVELVDPQGRTVATADGPDDWMWEEEITLIAEVSGPYRLNVHPYLENARPGAYRVRIDGPRAPRDADRTRIEAVREMLAAHALPQDGQRLDPLERAIRIWRSLGDRRRQAEALYQVTETLAGLGRTEEAAERFQQAVGLWKELGLPIQLAWTLLESSRVERRFFRGEEARRNMEEALRLAEAAGSTFLELRSLQALGRFHGREPRTAAPYLERAVRLARESGDRDMEMRCLYQLGFTLDDLAEKQDALVHFEQSLRLSRELHDKGQEANALNSIGHLYVSLGDWDKAVEHLEQAVALSRNGEDAALREAAALNNLALVYEIVDAPKARGLYESALTLGRKAGDREMQAKAIGNLALLDLAAGDAASALERCRDALGLTAGDTDAEGHLRFVMGRAYRRLGDLESSRREIETALRLARERGDRATEAKVIAELARTDRRAGDLPRALAHLKEGVRILESIRAEVVEQNLRVTFLASRQDTYQLLIDTLMSLHREQPDRGYDAEALQTSEQARARTLLDILTEAGADVREGADPGLIESERRLLADIEALERSRLDLLEKGGDSPAVREVTDRLAAALEEHARVEAALRVSSPRYAALTQPRPASVAEIQRDVLDGRALLLEYSLGDERSHLWAVTPDSLQSFELPPRARIEEAARRWYGALVVHPEDADHPEAAEEVRKAADELGAMLLGPVEGLLSGQPLLVVGDGALQYIPFGALPVPSLTTGAAAGRAPLIFRHEVVSLPSASVLAVLRRELAGRSPAPKALALLADPVFRLEDSRVVLNGRRGAQLDLRAGEIDPRRLPRLFFSRREAEAIAKLVPKPQRFEALGFAATRSVATSGELASYRMIHFATHGLIDSRRPELSTLVLSLVNERGEPQNGFLRLHDVYNLDLGADLVVLSACQTALGQEIRGEGLVGLTRGFMYAGAARVLASLWSVDDRATSELMERFYGHMISGRLSPAAALRQAQIEMSRDPRWRSPYYWAGFSLQGEWR